MIGRALQWVGALALLGLGVAGIAALALVRDRLHVTIEDEGAAAARPDPLALVRDDLQQLHRDLEAIAGGLDTNLGRVGAELSRGAERDRSLQDGLDALARAPDPSLAAIAALRQDVGRLAAALERRTERAEVSEPTAPPATTEPRAAVPAPTELPAPEPAGEAPPAESGSPAEKASPAVPPAPLGFLSFELPSASFAFDTPCHYRVVASLSRVGFDAKSTLHDFSGVTSKIAGDVYANLADPHYAWRGEISCEAAALHTGVEGRDQGMREHLDSEHHPRIRFEVTGFHAAPGGIDAAARRAKGTVTGRMTIRGVTRELEVPVEIATDASHRVVVSGQAPLRLSDYGVPVPSQLGVISMQDEVRIWMELRARAIGRAGGADGDH